MKRFCRNACGRAATARQRRLQRDQRPDGRARSARAAPAPCRAPSGRRDSRRRCARPARAAPPRPALDQHLGERDEREVRDRVQVAQPVHGRGPRRPTTRSNQRGEHEVDGHPAEQRGGGRHLHVPSTSWPGAPPSAASRSGRRSARRNASAITSDRPAEAPHVGRAERRQRHEQHVLGERVGHEAERCRVAARRCTRPPATALTTACAISSQRSRRSCEVSRPVTARRYPSPPALSSGRRLATREHRPRAPRRDRVERHRQAHERDRRPAARGGPPRRRAAARAAGGPRFALVLTSPRRARARDGGGSPGWAPRRSTGPASSSTTASTRGSRRPRSARRGPGWSMWTDGAPGGETADDVGARADRVIERALGGRTATSRCSRTDTCCASSAPAGSGCPPRYGGNLMPSTGSRLRARLRARAPRRSRSGTTRPPAVIATPRLRGERLGPEHRGGAVRAAGRPPRGGDARRRPVAGAVRRRSPARRASDATASATGSSSTATRARAVARGGLGVSPFGVRGRLGGRTRRNAAAATRPTSARRRSASRST